MQYRFFFIFSVWARIETPKTLGVGTHRARRSIDRPSTSSGDVSVSPGTRWLASRTCLAVYGLLLQTCMHGYATIAPVAKLAIVASRIVQWFPWHPQSENDGRRWRSLRQWRWKRGSVNRRDPTTTVPLLLLLHTVYMYTLVSYSYMPACWTK